MFIIFLTGGQSDGQFDVHSEWTSIYLRCETGVENSESERCPDPVLSGFLCRFGATQGSKLMTMNDVRIRFSADFYIASVRNSCRES